MTSLAGQGGSSARGGTACVGAETPLAVPRGYPAAPLVFFMAMLGGCHSNQSSSSPSCLGGPTHIFLRMVEAKPRGAVVIRCGEQTAILPFHTPTLGPAAAQAGLGW